jgi:hypothetical protein
VLTKHWTDWVDYWDVDFDYMIRKEIIKVVKDSGISEPQAKPYVPEHEFEERPGRYTIAVKVTDIFGNDTMTLVPVSVG